MNWQEMISAQVSSHCSMLVHWLKINQNMNRTYLNFVQITIQFWMIYTKHSYNWMTNNHPQQLYDITYIVNNSIRSKWPKHELVNSLV